MKKMSNILLAFVKLTGVIPAYIFFKPKIFKTSESCRRFLPKKAILMSNHTSLLDFVLYELIFCFRRIHFLMAEVLFRKSKLFSWFLYKLGGIFVDRDACNFSFVEESLKVLKKKQIVGVFPQGRLPVNGVSFPFKPGIVLIALKTDSPIVPVYTDGNYGLFKRAHILIGDEIYLRDFVSGENIDNEELKRLTNLLEEKNNELKAELEKRLNRKK